VSVWDSDGYQALLRGMRDNPRSDLHRLVTADYLEENGKAEYAEWIRLGVEYGAGSREKKLLCRMHELAEVVVTELRVPYLTDDSRGGWRCSSVGMTPTPNREGTICYWDRGFVSKVRTTCRQWIGETCPVCNGQKYMGSLADGHRCWNCQGTGKVPPMAAALVWHQPVETVEFADCNPTTLYQRRQHRGPGFEWWWADSEYGGRYIPRELHAELQAGTHIQHGYSYPSRADAEWDLSRAAIRWASKLLAQRGTV
jgi:uncharacterized protein (TIGR02996 family)